MRSRYATLWIALVIPFAFLCVQLIYSYRVALLAAGHVVLTPAVPVRLQDSLPELSGDLGDLEAFTMAPYPGGRADRERAIWWAPAADSLRLEYYTERRHLDSTELFVWSDAFGSRQRISRRERSVRWSLPLSRIRNGWEEIVGVYVSRPKAIDLRSPDSGVALFERVEGRVLHRVRGAYRVRRLPVVIPDTTYPVQTSLGSEIHLLARGDALAIVNPEARDVSLGLIGVLDGLRTTIRVSAGKTQVYRTLLRGRKGPLLAYTNPGTPVSLFSHEAPVESFFWLDRRPDSKP